MKEENKCTIYIRKAQDIDKDKDKGSNTARKISEEKTQNGDSPNNSSINNQDNNFRKKKIIKFVISFVVLTVVVGIVTFLLLYYKPWNKKEEEHIIPLDPPPNDDKEIIPLNLNDFKNELRFQTKVNDIKILQLKRYSNEYMMINGIEMETRIFRMSKYIIYIISEKKADDAKKGLYDIMYTGFVSLASKCISREKEECEPEDFVNLLNDNKKNLENLTVIDDLKDIPIAACLFNITDTNIITSIECPESLSEGIKNQIFTDLSYFRPNAILSSTKKHEMGLTTDENKKHIRKQSKGLCDISSNSSSSFCDIDSNITKDSEGNLLSFEQTSSYDIFTDINNTLSNYMKTHLVDETSQIKNLNLTKFKSRLNNLLSQLSPYMKYEEINTINTTKKVEKQSNSKVITDRTYRDRYLEENVGGTKNKYLIKEESLFSTNIYGADIRLNLKIDTGINTETMKTFLILIIGEKTDEIYKIEQPTNITKIIKKWRSISNNMNYLSYLLYEKLMGIIDDFPQDLSRHISTFNNHIFYKDFTEIFDASLFSNGLQFISFDIIEDSNKLFEKLNKTLNQIEDKNSVFKNNSLVLKNNIDKCLGKSYDIMNNIFIYLDNLTNLLRTPENKFSEILNNFSNNTPIDYANIIQIIVNIFLDYSHEKLDYINETIETTLYDFNNNYFNSIDKSKENINIMCNKLQKNSIKIENAKNEDYEYILKVLNNSNEFTDVIKYKIINEIKQIFNYNQEYLLPNRDKYNKSLEKSNETVQNITIYQYIDKDFGRTKNYLKNNFTENIKYINEKKKINCPLNDDVLEELFPLNEKNNIKNKILECGKNIINKIKNESEYYTKLVNETVNEFVDNNLESLNSIITDLSILLSDDSLEDLSSSFQYAFNYTLDEIDEEISFNKLLIEKFYNAYNTPIDIAYIEISDINEFSILSYEKKINQSYFTNYNILKGNEEALKNYISTKLYDDFFEVYENIIVKFKEKISSLKNNKITDLYPGIKKFFFYNKHMNIIDELNERFIKYFSLDIFNREYLPIINSFITQKTQEIENVISFINSQHNIFKNFGTIKNIIKLVMITIFALK